MDWFLYDIGLRHERVNSPNEKRSLELLERTTKFVNRHFQVGLLWKDDFSILQNNHELAIQRFESLEKRFSKDPEFFNMYRTQISDYITSGQAKLLSPEEKNNTSSTTNCISHRVVSNVTSPIVSFVMLQPRSTKYAQTIISYQVLIC